MRSGFLIRFKVENVKEMQLQDANMYTHVDTTDQELYSPKRYASKRCLKIHIGIRRVPCISLVNRVP